MLTIKDSVLVGSARASSGASWTVGIPPGLSGNSIMLQVVALDTSASNGLFAASDAHEVRFP